MKIGSPVTTMIGSIGSVALDLVPASRTGQSSSRQKILVTARSSRNVESQLVAALDFKKSTQERISFQSCSRERRVGQPFRKTHTIVLREDSSDTLRWLCALNSPLGHAWFAKQAGPGGRVPKSSRECPCLDHSIRPSRKPWPHCGTAEAPKPSRTPTWNPGAGIIPEGSDLFDEELEQVRRDNAYWRAVQRLNDLVLRSYELSPTDAHISGLLRGMYRALGRSQECVATLPAHTYFGCYGVRRSAWTCFTRN